MAYTWMALDWSTVRILRQDTRVTRPDIWMVLARNTWEAWRDARMVYKRSTRMVQEGSIWMVSELGTWKAFQQGTRKA